MMDIIMVDINFEEDSYSSLLATWGRMNLKGYTALVAICTEWIEMLFLMRMWNETTLESAFMDSTSTLHGLLHENEIAFRMNVREDDRSAYIPIVSNNPLRDY